MWSNCLQYSGSGEEDDYDDIILMAREAADVFQDLYADRIYAPTQYQSSLVLKGQDSLVGEEVLCYRHTDFSWKRGKIAHYSSERGRYRIDFKEAVGDEPVGEVKNTKEDYGAKEKGMPSLLPMSVLSRLATAEVSTLASVDESHQWVRMPSADVVLLDSSELDGDRWDGEWPGRFEATVL